MAHAPKTSLIKCIFFLFKCTSRFIEETNMANNSFGCRFIILKVVDF